MNYLIDTHCHVHDEDYQIPAGDVIARAKFDGIGTFITMGATVDNSRLAAQYARENSSDSVKVLAGLGIYPHQAGDFKLADIDGLKNIYNDYRDVIGAVGEVGIDCYYDDVPLAKQIEALEAAVDLAAQLDLMVSFHVRSGDYGDAFGEFFALIDNFGGRVRGVVHSFTDTMTNLEQVLARGLYVGVNGIATFNRDPELAEVFKQMPLDRIVLETDAPYLSPKPYRGKVNQPARVRQVAEFLADYRSVTVDQVATATTENFEKLCRIK